MPILPSKLLVSISFYICFLSPSDILPQQPFFPPPISASVYAYFFCFFCEHLPLISSPSNASTLGFSFLLPPLLAFTATGLGLTGIEYLSTGKHRRVMIDEFTHNLDERDKKLAKIRKEVLKSNPT